MIEASSSLPAAFLQAFVAWQQKQIPKSTRSPFTYMHASFIENSKEAGNLLRRNDPLYLQLHCDGFTDRRTEQVNEFSEGLEAEEGGGDSSSRQPTSGTTTLVWASLLARQKRP
jgi:hypothetical protein